MAKFIDIDAVDLPIGEAKILGTTYRVKNMSVKSLLNIIALADRVDQSDTGRTHDYLMRTAESLHEMIPECPVENFMKLTMDQMNALIAWTRGLGAKDAEDAEVKAEEDKTDSEKNVLTP